MTTVLSNNRPVALQVGYLATDWTVRPEFLAYAIAAQDWDIKAVERDGVCIGAVYRKGTEVHASILKEWRGKWVTKGLLKQLLSGSMVTTKVTPGHEYMFGILQRVGFKETTDHEFAMEGLNHGH